MAQTEVMTNPPQSTDPISGAPTTPMPPQASGNPAQYDPSNPQPYVAPPLPPVTPPAIQQAPEGSNRQPSMTTTAGGIAQVGAGLMRGIMNGMAMAQFKKAVALKGQTDRAWANYSLAAQHLNAVHQSGADPNGKEYQEASAAAQSAWESWTTAYNKQVDQLTGEGKKHKKGGKQQSAGTGPGGLDPVTAVQTIGQIMAKRRAPIFDQLGNPQAQQMQRETAGNVAQTQNVQSKLDLQKAQLYQQKAALYQQRQTATPEKQAEIDKQIQGIDQQIAGLSPAPKETTAKTPYEEQLAAFRREHGREPTVEENQKLAEGVRPEPKEPASMEDRAADAEAKRLGRPLTAAEIEGIHRKFREDPMAGVRAELAQMRFDEAQQNHVDAITQHADDETLKHHEDIAKRMKALDDETRRTGSQAATIDTTTEEGQKAYKKAAAQIEKDDYTEMIAIGKNLQHQLAAHGIHVDAPAPQPWTTSYLDVPPQDWINQHMPKQGGAAPAPAATKWAAPSDAPPAPAEDGHQLAKDGKILAVSKGGQWVQP
jgi:hypothetical protein